MSTARHRWLRNAARTAGSWRPHERRASSATGSPAGDVTHLQRPSCPVAAALVLLVSACGEPLSSADDARAAASREDLERPARLPELAATPGSRPLADSEASPPSAPPDLAPYDGAEEAPADAAPPAVAIEEPPPDAPVHAAVEDAEAPPARWIALEVLLASAPLEGSSNAVAPDAAAPLEAHDLDPRQRRHLQTWFRRVGEARPDESFGQLVVRAARARLGAPYAPFPEPKGEERLTVRADAFDCLTLVESSTAVARCVWLNTPEVECFVGEIRQTRYRDGVVDGYSSRLHYFEDWIYDNARRGRIRPLIRELGLTELATDLIESAGRRDFDYMTSHPQLYRGLDDPAVHAAIAAIEERISAIVWPVLPKARIPDVLGELRDGDIVGFVKGIPGLGVGHTGLVSLDRHGRPRILHATDRSGHVSLSACDLASCEVRRTDRVGVMVLRPLPPAVAGEAGTVER